MTQLDTRMEMVMAMSLPRRSRNTLASGRNSNTMANMDDNSTPRQLGLMVMASSHCSKQ